MKLNSCSRQGVDCVEGSLRVGFNYNICEGLLLNPLQGHSNSKHLCLSRMHSERDMLSSSSNEGSLVISENEAYTRGASIVENGSISV